MRSRASPAFSRASATEVTTHQDFGFRIFPHQDRENLAFRFVGCVLHVMLSVEQVEKGLQILPRRATMDMPCRNQQSNIFLYRRDRVFGQPTQTVVQIAGRPLREKLQPE